MAGSFCILVAMTCKWLCHIWPTLGFSDCAQCSCLSYIHMNIIHVRNHRVFADVMSEFLRNASMHRWCRWWQCMCRCVNASYTYRVKLCDGINVGWIGIDRVGFLISIFRYVVRHMNSVRNFVKVIINHVMVVYTCSSYICITCQYSGWPAMRPLNLSMGKYFHIDAM